MNSSRLLQSIPDDAPALAGLPPPLSATERAGPACAIGAPCEDGATRLLVLPANVAGTPAAAAAAPPFRVDPTPRRADGEYIAHARISSNRADGTEYDVHFSRDLAGFDRRTDAIAYARNWAQAWVQANYR